MTPTTEHLCQWWTDDGGRCRERATDLVDEWEVCADCGRKIRAREAAMRDVIKEYDLRRWMPQSEGRAC